MTSSMLGGERRWGSSRRGGMTVLGKVAVPKPLNLPSQRLENHGLDPNVEIVPKGSLSWGSRSSSSGSNPWGPSALSPNADGATGSSSHLSGRPSSSGSGTRPSTAGSDRLHESTASAWGPNSRPSSASAALTSNQTSLVSLRPRSAETRPGSSQLSRFAEPLSDNSVACDPTRTVEKLVVASSKNDGFSLSSGDFPTLGSERDNCGKNIESQEHGSHGRPSSSSGQVAYAKERTIPSQVVNSGAVNTWKRDGNQHIEDVFQPSAEKRQGDPQHYLNANIPPQHFDAWHGPPINAPAGVWYRGPPGGPPYPPVAPAGFPIEPFPYYHPQFPLPALANSQPVPLSGAGPRGHHPKNGDLYRPQIPDAYIRPGMPIRPGFYPGPVAYEGYYGPPMGYCNSSERDTPFVGMAAGPPSVHNRYSAQNALDPSNAHTRAGGHGSSVKTLVSEQAESGHSDETRGPYKVLVKQHNEWDPEVEEDNRERTAPGNASYIGKGNQPRTAMPKNEWGADNRRDEVMYSKRTLGENFGNQGSCSLDSVIVKSPESMGKAKAADDSWGKKPELVAQSFLDVPQLLPANPKDSTLIHKIEGLNAKARASDGRHDVASASSREEQTNRLQVVNAKTSNYTNEVGTPAVCFERTHATGYLIRASPEGGVSTGETTLQSTATGGTAISRRAYHGVHGSVDQHSKGRFKNQDADGWPKNPQVTESSRGVLVANVRPASSVHAQDHCISVEAAEKSEIDLPGKDEGESLTPVFDPSDCQAQRAKMKELAKQRAIQLQKEEEERIREQKGKALAKLEELNRRAQAGHGSIQKLEKAVPSGAISLEHEKSSTPAEPVMIDTKCEAPSSDLVSNLHVVAQASDSSTSGVGESTVLSSDLHLDTPKKEPAVPHGQSLPSKLDAYNTGAADGKAAPQVNEGSVSRHKRMGYKQKQNPEVEKNLTEKLIPVCATEVPKSHTGIVVNDIASTVVVPGEVGSSCESSLPDNTNVISPESSAHQKRKNNRSGKNKQKLCDTSSPAAFTSLVPKETNPAKASPENRKPQASQFELDPSSVQSVTDVKDVIQPSEQNRSLPTEEAHGRVHNQWKSQQSHRMPRNPQAYKSADKFHGSEAVIWAPVRSQSKAEAVDEARQKTVPDAVTKTTKSDNLVHNSLKSKRAELERYVPKPVAKELSQQSSVQQLTPSSFSQATSQEAAVTAESGFQSTECSRPASPAIGKKIGTTVESKKGDSKQNKQAKAHGAWRQLGSVESSSTSNPSKNVQKYMDQHESFQVGTNSVKVEPSVSDEWSDGWNTPEYSTAAAPVTSDVKYQGGVTGKVKQHPYKGHRNTRNNHDLNYRNINSRETDKGYIQSAAPEISQTERIMSSKENRSIGERTSSQWQPKSPTNYQRGGQNVSAEVSNTIKKDSSPPQGRVQLPSQPGKESSEVIPRLHPDQSVSENMDVGQTQNLGREEGRRERKVASSRRRPLSPNQGGVSMDEMAPPAGMDARFEQRISSGYRKNGSQSNRSGRGHESRGDWSSAGQDNKQHQMNRERQGHYEYQPVGSFNNNKSNNFEVPAEGSRNMGSRYRERGRRGGGNFYGRQSGTVQVDAGYNEWE